MTYRTDPRWLAARDNQVRDRAADETVDDAIVRRMRATLAMFHIESEYERAVAS